MFLKDDATHLPSYTVPHLSHNHTRCRANFKFPNQYTEYQFGYFLTLLTMLGFISQLSDDTTLWLHICVTYGRNDVNKNRFIKVFYLPTEAQ
jgi:hypothetical protein